MLLSLTHRMDLPAACASSCAMLPAKESDHSATGMLLFMYNKLDKHAVSQCDHRCTHYAQAAAC